jgi:hypothetical protein
MGEFTTNMKMMKKNLNIAWNFRKLCHESENATNCDGIFGIVHKCNAEFVNHAMQSSDPFVMCSNNMTFLTYRFTIEYYNKLFTTRDPKNSSALCADLYLNKNRMNLVMNLVSNSKMIWQSANCDDCYGDLNSANFSRNTEEFLESHLLYDECVLNVTKLTQNSSLVCTECNARYEALNSIYEQIKKSSNNKICFDLEDKVSR